MRHVISVKVENKSGVLARVAGLSRLAIATRAEPGGAAP